MTLLDADVPYDAQHVAFLRRMVIRLNKAQDRVAPSGYSDGPRNWSAAGAEEALGEMRATLHHELELAERHGPDQLVLCDRAYNRVFRKCDIACPGCNGDQWVVRPKKELSL